MVDAEITPESKRSRVRRYARRYMRVPLSVRTGDLPKRAVSAVVMLAIAGSALVIGGWAWKLLVGLVALGVLGEWLRLSRSIGRSPAVRVAWAALGFPYVGFCALTLIGLRDLSGLGVPDGSMDMGLFYVPLVVGAVVAVDVGAYFSGRMIGGPKIAPRISPSKTWAGLAGGAAAAIVFITAWYALAGTPWPSALRFSWIAGLLCAIVAQCGDFFQSLMKRRAGVKDSGGLIPGHGGLFDRVDGLMAVLLVAGLVYLPDPGTPL